MGGVLLLLIVVGALLPAPEEDDNGESAPAAQVENKRVAFELDAPTRTDEEVAVITGTVTPADAKVLDEDNNGLDVNASGEFRVRVRLPRPGPRSFTYRGFAPEHRTNSAEVTIRRVESPAQRRARVARQKAQRAAREARRKQDFVNSAETIPYGQLQKDPNAYVGKKVKYYGRIFQIQQDGAFGVILLSVTDEGYDFWSDEIWVNYAGMKVAGAEEDFLTVYGVVDGQKSFETQIGGERYVPEITAEFIEE